MLSSSFLLIFVFLFYNTKKMLSKIEFLTTSGMVSVNDSALKL